MMKKNKLAIQVACVVTAVMQNVMEIVYLKCVVI